MNKLFVLFSVVVFAVSAGATCSSTYYIGNKTDLDKFRDAVNKANGETSNICGIVTASFNYSGTKVVADDLSGLANGEPSIKWSPIKMFAGTFDGQGHTISGLYYKVTEQTTEYNKKSYYDAGFFANISGNAVIKNIRIEDSYFAADERAGGITADVKTEAKVTIDNVSFKGIITTVTTDNSCASVTDIGKTTVNGHFGGLIGTVSSGAEVLNLSNSYNEGKITSTSKCVHSRTSGGLIGSVQGSGTTVKINNCYNAGTVENVGGTGSSKGEIIADNASSSKTTATNVTCTTSSSSCNAVVADVIAMESSFNTQVKAQKEKEVTDIKTNVNAKGVTFAVVGTKLVATFTDASDEYALDRDVFVDEVVFSRKFVKNAMSTVVLPFYVSGAAVSNAQFFDYAGINKSGSPWKVDMAPLCDYDNGGCSGQNLVAYHPYYIKRVTDKAENDSTLAINGGVTLIATSGASLEYRGQAGESYADGLTYANDWALQGVYAKKTWLEGDAELGSVYGQAAKDKDGSYKAGDFIKAGKNSFIKPLRAYLVHRNAPTAGAKKRALTKTDAEEELPSMMTYNILPYKAVESINQGSETDPEMEGPLGIVKAQKIPANMLKMDRWYDVKGRSMKMPAAQGAYIKNDIPVIVK